jgi:hypothetical protein
VKRLLLALALLACLAVPVAEAAEPRVLETAVLTDKTAAQKVEAAARAAGFTQTRVLTRYSIGHGWVSSVLVEGVAADRAAQQAEKLAALAGARVQIFRPEGGRLVLEGEARGVVGAPAPVPTTRGSGSVAELLARAEVAHGGGLAGEAEVPLDFTRGGHDAVFALVLPEKVEQLALPVREGDLGIGKHGCSWEQLLV